MSSRDAMHTSLRRAAVGAAVEDLLARWRVAHSENLLGSDEELDAQLDAVCAPFGFEAWLTANSIDVDHGDGVDTYLIGEALVEALSRRWWSAAEAASVDAEYDESLELLDDSDFEERWEGK